MSLRFLTVLGFVLLFGSPCPAQEKFLAIEVKPGQYDAVNVPVSVPLSLPNSWAGLTMIALKLSDGTPLIGQLTTPGLLTLDEQPAAPKLIRRDLHFVLPTVKAGQGTTLKTEPKRMMKYGRFAWKEEPGEYAELTWQGEETRPVLRYMHKTYDPSTPAKRDQSYKVFHHLYDPAGTHYVTNGGQTDPDAGNAKLLYPHHRGLMYAFNRITYGDRKQADTWHATKGAHQAHIKTLTQEAGPVLGRHCVQVGWFGNETDEFAKEERELTVYRVPGGTLVDFVSRLETTGGKVRLDGDPQHAGFQFRAANAVAAKTAKQTYYLRPDGQGEPGATRNWDPKNKGPIDLPWDVLSFVLDQKRYSVAYLNSPTNPKESRFSERDYGRFGCYFEYELTKERPLTVSYRIWLQDGPMSGPQAQALYDAFAAPPYARVKSSLTPDR